MGKEQYINQKFSEIFNDRMEKWEMMVSCGNDHIRDIGGMKICKALTVNGVPIDKNIDGLDAKELALRNAYLSKATYKIAEYVNGIPSAELPVSLVDLANDWDNDLNVLLDMH